MSVLAHTDKENLERSPKLAKLDVVTSLRVKRLSEHAILPSRGSSKAAGYDLSRRVAAAVPFHQGQLDMWSAVS